MILLVIFLSAFKLPIEVNGSFSRSAKLLAKDGVMDDSFGVSVSIYGTTAMIGAQFDDDKATDAGIVNLPT
jgi:hypothetical protein